jgi:hypothetical protein
LVAFPELDGATGRPDAPISSRSNQPRRQALNQYLLLYVTTYGGDFEIAGNVCNACPHLERHHCAAAGIYVGTADRYGLNTMNLVARVL